MPMDKSNIMQRKLGIWALSCIAISFLFLNSLEMPSLSYLQSCGLYPWVVLLLCTYMAYVKRNGIFEKIRKEREKSVEISNIIIGLLIIIISVLLPKDLGLAAVVFEMLLAFLGIFIIFFGGAALYPGILLGIYGFSVGFPVILSRYLETQYSLATVWIVSAALKITGFEFISQGSVINYSSSSGQEISLLVDSACSGSGSMSIFIALFALIMLDIKLPRKGAAYMFIFGVLGTTIQNVVRIAIIVFAGFYYGPGGVLAAHSYAGYVLFPVWFFVFVYVYFRYARKFPRVIYIKQ